MRVHCSANDVSRLVGSHPEPLTQGPEQGCQVLSWHSLDEALRARDLRKASLRAEFAGHKQIWLGSVAGCSAQHISRCLSARYSDELKPEQITKIRAAIGVAGERRAA